MAKKNPNIVDQLLDKVSYQLHENNHPLARKISKREQELKALIATYQMPPDAYRKKRIYKSKSSDEIMHRRSSILKSSTILEREVVGDTHEKAEDDAIRCCRIEITDKDSQSKDDQNPMIAIKISDSVTASHESSLHNDSEKEERIDSADACDQLQDDKVIKKFGDTLATGHQHGLPNDRMKKEQANSDNQWTSRNDSREFDVPLPCGNQNLSHDEEAGKEATQLIKPTNDNCERKKRLDSPASQNDKPGREYVESPHGDVQNSSRSDASKIDSTTLRHIINQDSLKDDSITKKYLTSDLPLNDYARTKRADSLQSGKQYLRLQQPDYNNTLAVNQPRNFEGVRSKSLVNLFSKETEISDTFTDEFKSTDELRKPNITIV